MDSGPLKAPYSECNLGHPDNISRIRKLTYYTVPTAKWQLESRLMPASILKETGKRGSIYLDSWMLQSKNGRSEGEYISGQGENESVRKGREMEREFQIALLLVYPCDKSAIKSSWGWLIYSNSYD